jgi:hypothetical protein
VSGGLCHRQVSRDYETGSCSEEPLHEERDVRFAAVQNRKTHSPMTMDLGARPAMPTDRPQAGTSARFSQTAAVGTYTSDRLGFRRRNGGRFMCRKDENCSLLLASSRQVADDALRLPEVRFGSKCSDLVGPIYDDVSEG